MVRDIIILIYVFGLGVISLILKLDYALQPKTSLIFIVSIPIFIIILVLPELIKPNSRTANFLTKKII